MIVIYNIYIALLEVAEEIYLREETLTLINKVLEENT